MGPIWGHILCPLVEHRSIYRHNDKFQFESAASGNKCYPDSELSTPMYLYLRGEDSSHDISLRHLLIWIIYVTSSGIGCHRCTPNIAPSLHDQYYVFGRKLPQPSSSSVRTAFRDVQTMTSSNGNIFRVTGPLCGELTGDRWIPLTKASDAELWHFLWSAPE